MHELHLKTSWKMVEGVKGEFSYPLLLYLSKKVISPSHLKILATPLTATNCYCYFISSLPHIIFNHIVIGCAIVIKI
jgi:hypothetical protein